MRDFTEDLADIARRVRDAHQYLRIDDARKRLSELEAAASDTGALGRPRPRPEGDERPLGRARRRRSRRRPRPAALRCADAVRARSRGSRRLRRDGDHRPSSTRCAPPSTGWSCARSSAASTTSATRSAKCIRARAAPTRRTGPRCCCACTPAGRSRRASTSRSTRPRKGKRPASRRRRSSSRAGTPTACWPASGAYTG